MACIIMMSVLQEVKGVNEEIYFITRKLISMQNCKSICYGFCVLPPSLCRYGLHCDVSFNIQYASELKGIYTSLGESVFPYKLQVHCCHGF